MRVLGETKEPSVRDSVYHSEIFVSWIFSVFFVVGMLESVTAEQPFSFHTDILKSSEAFQLRKVT